MSADDSGIHPTNVDFVYPESDFNHMVRLARLMGHNAAVDAEGHPAHAKVTHRLTMPDGWTIVIGAEPPGYEEDNDADSD